MARRSIAVRRVYRALPLAFLCACGPSERLTDPDLALTPSNAKGGGGGTCSVSIPKATTSFTIEPSSVVLAGIGGTQRLTVKAGSTVIDACALAFSSGDAAIASVSTGGSTGGLVTSVGGGGPITITARTASGKVISGTAQVTVRLADAIEANSPTSQSGTVGTAVTSQPSVKVMAGGVPVANVPVTFTASEGGTVSPSTVTTNGSGIATVSSWALGTTTGAHTVTATVPGLGATVQFTATAAAGAVASLVEVDGNSQSGTVGEALANPVRVKAADSYGNAVSGVSVQFAAASGSGSIAPATVTTGDDGIAAASWTLGTSVGTHQVTATAASLSAVSFSATAQPGAPDQLVKNSADNQSATVGAAVAAAPSVVVQDQYGNVVSGAQVAFTALSGGGNASPSTVTADASGVATASTWTLGTTAGANTLRASSGSASVNFTATGVADAPAQMVRNSANNQSATVNASVSAAPSVVVTDQFGNPVSGVTVSFAVSAGGGSVSPSTVVTSSAGVATVTSWTLGTTAGANALTATSGSASVTFSATGVAGPVAVLVAVSSTTISAPKGTSVTPPSVRARDIYGNNVAGAAISFSQTRCPSRRNGSPDCGSIVPSSGTIATNALGVATLTSWTLSKTAGVNEVRAAIGANVVTFTATGN